MGCMARIEIISYNRRGVKLATEYADSNKLKDFNDRCERLFRNPLCAKVEFDGQVWRKKNVKG